MRKFIVFSVLFVGLLGTTVPCSAAPTETYDEEVKGSPLTYSSLAGNTMTFRDDKLLRLNRLIRNIKKDSKAFEAFKTELLKEFCFVDEKGTYTSEPTVVTIECTTRMSASPSTSRTFTQAHCAGFCVMHSSTFRKYEYNKANNNFDCICKSGNARDLVKAPNADDIDEDKEKAATVPPQAQSNTNDPAIATATERFKRDMENLRNAFIKKIQELQKK